jgi:SPP1 family predicted phage head-tail adaptor
MANEGVVTHRVRMRYTSGLKPKMRLTADGRTFEIMSAVERGRREEHELLVSEVVD